MPIIALNQSLNEALTHCTSLSPTWVATDQIRFVALSTDFLYVSGGGGQINGMLQAPHTVWERVHL